MKHEWTKGANILGADLATCSGCNVLRVRQAGTTRYIFRTFDTDARIKDDPEPLCVAPPRGNLEE